MTAAESALLERLDAFSPDGPDPPALPFAARLAREHGWDRGYAERAVREYKRFVFLAVTAGHPVCPSEQIDAVWHQHLTYTRSYWQGLCGETLGRPLHHNPTRGGGKEDAKHLAMYADTLAAYRRAFGHEPPADLWPTAEQRFGRDLHHRVVNTADCWVIPKRWAGRTAAAVGLLAAVGSAVGCVGLNPFALNGGEFFLVYIPAVIVAVAFGVAVRMLGRGPGATGDPPALSPAQLALLAGGPARLTTTTAAALVRSGLVRVSDDGKRLEKGSEPTGPLTPAEQVAYDSLPLANTADAYNRVRTEIAARVTEDEAHLRAAGLVMSPGKATGVRLLAVLPLALVLLGLGVPRLVMGLMNDKSVFFLIGAMAVTLVVTIIMWAVSSRSTRRGDAELRRRKAGWTNATEPPVGTDPLLGVALFGTAALAAEVYGGLDKWHPTTSTGSGGDGGSGCSSSSGSGCGGGGGCGGCGGGGD